MIVLQAIITMIFFTAGFYFSHYEDFRMAVPIFFVAGIFFVLIIASYLYERLRSLILQLTENVAKAMISINLSENKPELVWQLISDKHKWDDLSETEKELFSIGCKAGLLYEKCGKEEFEDFFSGIGKDTPGDCDIQERKQGE